MDNHSNKHIILRTIPSVDSLLETEPGKRLLRRYGRRLLLQSIRSVLDSLRREIQSGVSAGQDISNQEIWNRIEFRLDEGIKPSLGKAINAAGIILHTGLGRAVFPPDAVEAVESVSRGYCGLAVDRDSGRRSHRDIHLHDLICELTGAESATVVNNNAAATVLILNTLAAGKEVIVSRGQLVEIGGAFRMPDVMETSGAVMRGVGTTNKTHLKDYVSAINENSGALLRVHHSNYRIVGFFSEPDISEIVGVGREYGIPVVDDLGSGALVDLKKYGLEPEPMVRESIAAGVDLTCFSGDKLIGGPQSGIIVGKKRWVDAVKKNPLARAFRVDKMTIAALEATLKLFLDPEELDTRHPVYRMLSLRPVNLQKRASRFLRKIGPELPPGVSLEIRNDFSQVGSGSVPAESLPTKVLAVSSSSLDVEKIASGLRKNRVPIFSRISRDRVLLDLRTIQPEEDDEVGEALIRIFKLREKAE